MLNDRRQCMQCQQLGDALAFARHDAAHHIL